MIRLLFVSTGLGTGGAEMSLLNLLTFMDRSRFEPHVVALAGHGEVAAQIAALGVPVHELGLRAGNAPLRFAALVGAIRRLEPDVVQTWMYHGDLIGSLAARMAGVRRIAWGVRNSTLVPGSSKRSTIAIARACAWLSARLPRAIVSCSAVARDVHVGIGYDASRFVVIPNGFDLERYRPDPGAGASVRAELGLSPGTPLLAVVGRFDPQKNHLGYIEAAGRLQARMPGVHHVLVGKDLSPSNTALMNAIESAGLRGAVHLLGLRRDVGRLMAGADALVLPSVYGEAFPRVVGEAMACGTPCVVTDVGDSAAIVGDTGFAVPPGDTAALAEAMHRMLALPAADRRALGEAARRRVSEQFEIRNVTRRFERVYETLQRGEPCVA